MFSVSKSTVESHSDLITFTVKIIEIKIANNLNKIAIVKQ